MPIRRRIATAGTVLSLAVSGALLAAEAPAHAATSCYASSCTGLDPASTTCQDDAETIYTGDVTDVELRYSPSCRAAWARVRNSPLSGYITVTNSRGQSYSASMPGTGTGTVYTRMVNDAGITSYACDYNQYGHDCTTSY
jgi:uncharacterized protein DUF2690